MNTRITCKQSITLWALTCLVAAVACKDSPVEPPLPGTALVTLTTGDTSDGALILTLTGPGLGNVRTANTNYQLSWRLVSATELRVIVVGDLFSGPILTVDASDLRRISEYTGAVLEVADRDGQLRASTVGRTLSFSSALTP